MKRFAIIGCVAALGLFAYACGSSGGSQGPNCAKYVKCCDSLGGTSASTCDSTYGANSTSCNTSATEETACEAACNSAYASIQSSVQAIDAGAAAANCP